MPYQTPLTRAYIDTRPFNPSTSTKSATQPNELPLLSTLPPETQTSITRFLRLPDRLMSLSSALLKYHFIHTTAKIPWSDVVIARTPKPHSRPYWPAPDSWEGEWGGGLEFNVSHQAGMTCLVGCRTPQRDTELLPVDLNSVTTLTSASASALSPNPRLGIDISCVNEPGRHPPDVGTPAKLASWVDIFAEMFSSRERSEMKSIPSSWLVGPTISPAGRDLALRRFFTSWALKEAFIKLIGEGILASWLHEVEFLDVTPPEPISVPSSNTTENAKWTPPHKAARDFRVLHRGIPIPESKIRMDVVAFEEVFFVAVATRDIEELGSAEWVKLDIARDIRPCAEGRCRCLD